MSQFEIQHDIGDFPRRLQQLPRAVRQEVLEGAGETGQTRALSLFERVTRTWRHKPSFRVRADVRPTFVKVAGGTDDPVFQYVDLGTRPHTIEPRGPGYPLRFASGYRAKTIPGTLSGRRGGSFGREVRAMRVRHPGTRARRFSEMIGKDTLETIRKALGKQFGQAVRRGYQRIRLR